MDDRQIPRIREQPARGRAAVPVVRPSTLTRWGGRAFKGIIGAGALATAIAAVLALRPIDKEEFAAFRAVTITSSVPYSEYQQRSDPPHPLPQGLGRRPPATAQILVAVASAVPTEGPPGAEPDGTNTVTPDITSPGRTTSRTDSPDATTRPSTPGQAGPLLNRPPLAVQNSLRLLLLATPRPVPSKVFVLIKSQCNDYGLTRCEDFTKDLEELPFTDHNGNALSVTETKREMLAVIKDSRKTSAGKGKKELLGAVIDVNLELSGLRGKPVLLSWSLWRNGGTKRIYSAWLNDNLAYEMKAGSDHDSASLNFWIPLPKGRGPYTVRSKLTMNGSPLATADSKPIT